MTTKATPIEQAWAEVKADFELNLIPNEATLQAALYRALRSHFEGARVVCGVAAIPGEGKRQYPDLMVIKDEKVVAAIEVKVPSREGRVPGLPNYRADVRKLHGLIAAEATVDFHATWLEAGAPRPPRKIQRRHMLLLRLCRPIRFRGHLPAGCRTQVRCLPAAKLPRAFAMPQQGAVGAARLMRMCEKQTCEKEERQVTCDSAEGAFTSSARSTRANPFAPRLPALSHAERALFGRSRPG